jgi:ferredoxin--NADP+ reductase
VIAAIGYRMGPIEGVPIDLRRGNVINTDGRVAAGFYAVGWAKRGPTGVISTNKPDGDIAAEHIERDMLSGIKPGRPAFEEHLRARGVRWVSFEEWKLLDEQERSAAREGAPRKKFVQVGDMINFIDETKKAPGPEPD